MSEQLPDNIKNQVVGPDPKVEHEADVHLARLLAPASAQLPWYKGLVQSIQELINPPKLPPLEVTSKPIEVKTMKGLYTGNEWKAGVISAVVNVGVIALLLVIGTSEVVQQKVKETVTLIAPNLAVQKPTPKPPTDKQQGGGGGGNRSKLEASKGKAPRIAPRQFVPPRVDPIDDPKLPVTPTIVAGEVPEVNMAQYGDPNGRLGIASNGTGIGGSIGSGKGSGVGPGEGGGIGGGVFRIGSLGVSPPQPIFKPEPEYSEEARKAKYQGDVMIQLVVDENGNPQSIKVVRPLGLGLDEKAVEAVAKWRFRPGMKDGKPVKVQATIQVTFRLL